MFPVLFLLAACASEPQQRPIDGGPGPRPNASMTGRLAGAAATPLHDVNLIRTKIPDVLLDAMDAPYARPRPLTCPEILAEIQPLDQALGADLDRPAKPGDTGLLPRAQGLAGDAAVDAVKSASEGLLPYHSWVRLLSGAERQDRLVAAAITAGGVRRAYLKGMGLDRRCDAASQPTPDAQNAIAGAERLRKAADAQTANAQAAAGK